MQAVRDLHDDRRLFDRVVARDESALGELYDRHSALIFGLVLRILRNRTDAEDVLQEVFVQVWTRAASYDAALGAPAAWMVRIARNRAIDRLRASRTRERAVGQIEAPLPVETPERGAARSETRHAVLRVLEALPADQRRLIEHAYFEGRTQSELAELFGLPLGTVKTRVRAGMLALRRGLAAHHQAVGVDHGRPD